MSISVWPTAAPTCANVLRDSSWLKIKGAVKVREHVLVVALLEIQMHELKCPLSWLLTEPECHDGVMDLVFVIDGSKSLGPANFELVKQFVNSIVDSLDISRTGTHVGLIQYSTKVRTEFTLGQYVTGDSIKQAVGRMQYMGRGSRTGSALRHMFESSFSSREGGRPNTQQVTIVFTDGRSQDDVSEWASKAKSSGASPHFS